MPKKKAVKKVMKKLIKKAKRVVKRTTKKKVVRRPKSIINPSEVKAPEGDFDIERFRMKGPIPQATRPATPEEEAKATEEVRAEEQAAEIRAELAAEEAPVEDPSDFEDDDLYEDDGEGDPID